MSFKDYCAAVISARSFLNLVFTVEIQHVGGFDVNDLVFGQPILKAALILYYPSSSYV